MSLHNILVTRPAKKQCNFARINHQKLEVLHMELTGKRFCMVSDKEQMLQILNFNNVPSIELVEPKNCLYPIVGRKFGHHGGKDLVIINTKQEALDAGFDYFTKLYAIETEYCLEINGLTVKNVRSAVAKQVVFYEAPIRTEAFGWSWQEVDINGLAPEWMDMAIRALYLTGLKTGFVENWPVNE